MGALFNLARMTTATVGTGTITVGTAVPGFLTFAQSGVVDGQTVSYGIADGNNSEVGQGVYTAATTTLTRAVTKSTNSDAAISLSGSAQVYVTARAEDFVPFVSPAFTGTPTSTTPSTANNSTSIATTAYVQAQGYATSAALGNYLPLAGGTLTGNLNMTAGSFYQYNGVNLAYIVPNAVNGDNVFLGEAGNATVTGYWNIGNGPGALSQVTTGSTNVAVGAQALNVEATGNSNTAVGTSVLGQQNGAGGNTAIGAAAGYDITTGSNNVCLGSNTARGLTTGSGNTVIGANITGIPAAANGIVVLGASSSPYFLIDRAAANVLISAAAAVPLTATGSGNTGVGNQALKSVTTGVNNVAIGNLALQVNTTFSSNTAVGYAALRNCAQTNNTAVGANALAALTSGGNNTAVGVNALIAETTGSNNVAIGQTALTTQNGGSYNIGVGLNAGYDITTGGNNVFMGYAAGRGITTGSSNTVVGYNLTGMPAALAGTMVLGAAATKMSVVFGSNCFHGGSAGNLTLTGTANACMGWLSGTALTTGSNNCALGSSALTAETTGSASIAIGKNALSVQNGGGSNIAIGGTAGNTITTGSNNTFIGTNAGNTITTGTGNTFINYSAGLLTATTSNCFGWGMGGNIRQDWNLTTANTHTFTGGPVAQNATPAAGATPVFQSAGALSSTTTTTNTPALPASRTNGYLLIAFARVMGTTGTTLSCSTSGWTQIFNNAGSGRTFMAAYAYVTGSETAPTFTLGTTDISDAQVVMYSGTASTNPIGVSSVSSGGAVSSMLLGNIATTRYNSKMVAAILCGGLSVAITPPGGYTQQTTNTDGAWFDAPYVAAGTGTGSLTWTVSSPVSNWGGCLIELLIPPMTPAAQQHFGKTLGTSRWSVTLGDGTQEAGSNAGSNFAITPYSDAGVALTNALSITRSTGAAAFASTVRLSTGFTVANLPAAGPIGACAYVTDGTAALAWGATVTGGGSTPYHVWYNGTAWTVVGK